MRPTDLLLFHFIMVYGSRWDVSLKNIVVTGGTKGIGKAVVEECCELGGNVFTCGRHEDELRQCIHSLRERGYNVDGVIADVSTAAGRDIFYQAANKHFNGVVDVLVNNVGTNIRKKAIEYSEEEYKLIMSTNLESAFYLCQTFHPCLKASGKGSVINIGSVAGGNHLSIKSGVIYAMTKASLNQMAYNLACEWAKDNIRVNVVAPWYIVTPLTEKYLNDPETLQAIIERTPFRRVGTVEEVSAAVIFLALDASSYITGQVISVDGGFTRYGYY